MTTDIVPLKYINSGKNLLSECKMKGEVFFPFERDGEKSATTKDKYYLELYITEKHILLRK